MKKILILGNSSKGVYAFRNLLVSELLKKYQVTVAVPDTVCLAELEEEGCLVVQVPIDRRGVSIRKDLKLVFACSRLLRSLHPDLVLTYTIKPNVYGGFLCGMRKIPYIATVTGLGTTFQREGILKQLIIRLYRAGLKKADCVFFQNSENMKIFETYGISGKKTMLVSGSGVDLSVHIPEEYPMGEEITFLFIGRIMKDKGIEEFLAAAEKLHSPSVHFQVLGYCDEDYQTELEGAVERGVISYPGFQKQVHEYIKKASAVVLPTYHEGMSNVLMEASATARPVIASRISGCREIFEEGVTGFGCEARSAESLEDALRRFIALSDRDRRQMGRAARVKIENEFDRKVITDIYINEIETRIDS